MTRTIWLASYPKSGNTWMRMLIAGLSVKDGAPLDINALSERGGIASARAPFDHLLLIESGLLTHDESDALRPRVYEELAAGAQADEDDAPDAAAPVRFVKVHDAYTLTAKGEPLLAGQRGADGAIVIVRDPRDVALSLASHQGSTIDHAIAFMNDNHAALCGTNSRQHNQLRQKLPSWSGHVASWLGQCDIPIHLVRYEDMIADTIGMLRDVLTFADYPACEEQIRGAARLGEFARLREQEREHGFREAPQHLAGRGFFRRGEAGGWRDELTDEQTTRIEADHTDMMVWLGYELSTGGATRPAIGATA